MDTQPPTIGRIVLYRSRTGKYTVPAVVTATVDTLNSEGVSAGTVPALTSDSHVHLTVFTPGKPGMRSSADDFLVESPYPVSENVAGTYQEWDVPFWQPTATPSIPEIPEEQKPGTWGWPTIRQ